ncbi:DUF2834 domain-containing protein [Leifsonia sp. Le1]|uniref:DUF2834 domain-containing protein n=1 Tax=Leifsonia sp. Le1 TaxID=3404918 RepID=UPI003EBF7BB8
MTGPRWNGRAVFFLVVAVLGLAGTWAFNIAAIVQHRDYVGDWLQSGPAVSSLTVDVLIAAVAAIAFMVFESRRLGMRRVWVYVVLIPLVALAFALPLFLAMRERALAGRAAADAAAAPDAEAAP